MESLEYLKIRDHVVGCEAPPFIIAEMSGNHNRSLKKALEIVDAAAASGVHALKLQTYTPDSMTLNHTGDGFTVTTPQSPWVGRSLYELYQEAHTPWDWHEPIFARCRELGLICFSTPYDETAVDFLEDMNVPCYKVASFENSDLSLVRKIAQTGKPLLLSTGMATIAELDETVRCVRNAGCADLILLKCTSVYPSPPEASNLRTLPHLRELFSCEVGLSDHTIGIGAAIASVAFGSSIIEKHFTMNRDDGGVDALFSLEPAEMGMLVLETKRAWQALGKVQYGISEEETESLIFRRSLYVVEDMQKGSRLTEKNLRSIRPGYGLEPRYYDIVLGKKIRSFVKRGTPLSWEMLD